MVKDLVTYIAKALVDEPEGVEVNMIEGEKSTILELKVAPDDIGKVIGKHGRIAIRFSRCYGKVWSTDFLFGCLQTIKKRLRPCEDR